MKKKLLLLITMITSGCVPYAHQTDLSDCLSIGNYTNKITNEKIINELNSTEINKIQKITPTGNVKFGDGDSTECPVTVTHENGTSEQGFLISRGRWSQQKKIEYKFLSKWDAQQQVEENNAANKIRTEQIESQARARDTESKHDFQSASITAYPFKAEIYCYNKKNFNMYKPADCGISTSGKLGPTNIYDKQALTFDILLPSSFTLKASMAEPNLFMGIKVDIRSRKTNEVVNTRTGSYTDTVFISN
ncbi:hypothetical protein BL250_16670 [Erwinia sp. OLTSP20]|uniref:hypothetical protein n=1 Tax=unclassified Erwinia TaxID=2622719 RepID=UPI000C175403|nr:MULTISPECIES: hypothetical protein [unclassified Erwinia]PIJ48969.1 hypothetical protein BV501_14745 [Erwinia sp. OAMSP11]PIJ74623.1 hypothetical protein BK416_03950 [Erwinia sp. OLSSP12]PIJ79654.1 hypothetical protein BLD47_13370 [Erwinia sp. OLCASP19]PIJ80439.1 hypothetical protein BLD46_15215 [Erwinia sp. OLMTSP26]PIJ82554.1 hypothetical protein BLD49_15110 [Erwinia sp. OLMDSP33]